MVGTRTAAGSTTLPIISLYATAAQSFFIDEIGVSNTTATAVALKLCKLTSAATQGAGLTETSLDAPGSTAVCTAFTTHSSTGPSVVDMGGNVVLGAAVGSGWIWTFGASGVSVPLGTANGVGIIVATGTGQICDAYLRWRE